MFSADRIYRYLLWRRWDPAQRHGVFLMLNPSTADETVNDRTVAKCENWARQWGWGGLYVLNLFAYRSTDPKLMKLVKEPIGPDNDRVILKICQRAHLIVCAWGNDGTHDGRSYQVQQMLVKNGCMTKLFSLHRNEATGEPGHPLYLKNSTELTPMFG